MKSTSVFKKLAMFAVVLSLVLSVAGTALAHGGGPQEPPVFPDTVTVVYHLYDGESFTRDVPVIGKYTCNPHADFTLEGATREGFELVGWAVPGYTGFQAAGTPVTVNHLVYDRHNNEWCPIHLGARWLRVELTEYYNVYYTGTFIDGALFWPDDVENATTPPVIAGIPYRAGYYFSGWHPGTLDWTTAEKVVVEEIIDPEQGCPYIQRTITYTIHVEGGFTLEPVPTTPTTEVPVAAPQTGGIEWAGIAGVLAVVSALGIALIVRRRNDA